MASIDERNATTRATIPPSQIDTGAEVDDVGRRPSPSAGRVARVCPSIENPARATTANSSDSHRGDAAVDEHGDDEQGIRP